MLREKILETASIRPTCVVRELHGVHRVDVKSKQLQREDGALVAHVASDDVRLDAAGKCQYERATAIAFSCGSKAELRTGRCVSHTHADGEFIPV